VVGADLLGRARRKAQRADAARLLFGGAAVLLLMVPSLRAYASAPLGFALGLSAGWAGPSAR